MRIGLNFARPDLNRFVWEEKRDGKRARKKRILKRISEEKTSAFSHRME